MTDPQDPAQRTTPHPSEGAIDALAVRVSRLEGSLARLPGEIVAANQARQAKWTPMKVANLGTLAGVVAIIAFIFSMKDSISANELAIAGMRSDYGGVVTTFDTAVDRISEVGADVKKSIADYRKELALDRNTREKERQASAEERRTAMFALRDNVARIMTDLPALKDKFSGLTTKVTTLQSSIEKRNRVLELSHSYIVHAPLKQVVHDLERRRDHLTFKWPATFTRHGNIKQILVIIKKTNAVPVKNIDLLNAGGRRRASVDDSRLDALAEAKSDFDALLAACAPARTALDNIEFPSDFSGEQQADLRKLRKRLRERIGRVEEDAKLYSGALDRMIERLTPK